MNFKTVSTWWPARLDVNSDENIHIIDGYLSAARILVDAVRNKVQLSDELVYPIMYLFRHHLELKLKSIWRCLWKLGKLNQDHPKHHRLLDLWTECSDEIIKMTDMPDEEQQTIYECLNEFNEFDCNAESFRFHQRKDGIQIGQVLPALDIIPVVHQIDQCVEILEGVMLFLFYEVERNSEIGPLSIL